MEDNFSHILHYNELEAYIVKAVQMEETSSDTVGPAMVNDIGQW